MQPGVSTRFVLFPIGRAALVGADPGEKRGGGHHQTHVPMPAVPGPRFAVVKTQVVLGTEKTFLDGPAQPGRRSEVFQRGVRRRVGEIIGDGAGITQTPPRQKPEGKSLSGLILESRRAQ